MKIFCVFIVGLSICGAGIIKRGEGSEDDSVSVEDNYNDDSEDSFVSEETVNDESVLTRPGGYHRGHGNWTGKRIARSVGNGLNELQVSTNCRTVVAINVADPVSCSKIKQGELLKFDAVYSPGWGSVVTGGPHEKEHGQANPGQYQGSDPNWLDHYGNLDISSLPGRCRYDPYRALQDPTTACLCVATQETCTQNRDGCFWYDDKKTGYKECISKAEKFYNQLYALLKKRGKKSFAINIKYGATGARGELPLGPYGPAIIGAGNPNPSSTMGIYKQPAGTQPYPKPASYGPQPDNSYSQGGSLYGKSNPLQGEYRTEPSMYQPNQYQTNPSNMYLPNLPNLYQPNQPDMYQPNQPNMYQPNMYQPNQPNMYQPDLYQPNMYQPNQPNMYQPNQPNMYQPNQPILNQNQGNWRLDQGMQQQFQGNPGMNFGPPYQTMMQGSQAQFGQVGQSDNRGPQQQQSDYRGPPQ
ncbi:uncharacterized protein LOC111708994 isoform X3 [Eurytemora carolleeae]|uniref:uncharacterized protein LOC111708994 isoform X3 n=1 Tax=Eurytemora carolleeae TaxID=1294199 RepID=UPI000C782CB2|nr:uncharacterized protein LOC111708994 isoform X3 [Eurytemora carolleeae]|eukprot:XP_023338296.1 uncharacterized protein LOC111708994 isoform X3 [Eurytemora affinis]